MTTQHISIAPNRYVFGYYRQVWWNWFIGIAFFCGESGGSLFLLSLWTRYLPGMVLGYIIVLGKIIALWLHLGRRLRFWRAALRPDRSWIARAVWANGLFAASGLLLLCSEFLGRPLLSSGVNSLLKVVVIAAGAFLMFYDGFVMNSSAAIPFWNTKLLPLLIFMYASLGGLTLSLTLRMLVGYATTNVEWMERAEQYLLLANFALLAIYLVRMWRGSPAARETARTWLRGNYSWVFFGLIVAVGLLATLALSLVQQQIQARGIALLIAGCELTGDFALLILILKSGLFAPQTAPAFAQNTALVEC